MPKHDQELAAEMGKRMLQRRKELDMTQDQVAEAANLSPQFYSKVETGQAGLTSKTLAQVSEALQTSADYILTGRTESRYMDAVSVLEKMSNNQLQIAQQVLESMIDFRNSD